MAKHTFQFMVITLFLCVSAAGGVVQSGFDGPIPMPPPCAPYNCPK